MIDQSPECYESLAPERVLQGTPSTVASELFACGCVWWQLLTGRPAIAGANGLAKVKAVAEGQIPDVRQFAPDAPPVLAEVIAACTSTNPKERPNSFDEVARILGPPSVLGSKAIARCLVRPERWLLPRSRPKRKRSRLAHHGLEVATAAACIFVMIGAWRLMARPASTSATSAMASIKLSAERPVAKLATPTTSSSEVVPASFKEAAKRPRKPHPKEPEPLRLPTDRTIRLSTLTPNAGQLICGEADARPTVIVPAGGLVIDEPDVHFRDIDFLTDAQESSSPFIVLRTSGASFERCTFRASSADGTQRSAVSWEPSAESGDDDWNADADRLSLVNCIMHRVGTSIARSRTGEATIECVNVLQVDAGSLTRLASPVPNAAIVISLDRCTVRESGPVIEFLPSTTNSHRSGRVLITAVDCVFAPRADRAILELSPAFAAQDLNRLRWNGRDSLLETNTVLISSRDPSGTSEATDDSQLDLVGLVRSQLEFAGPSLNSPSSSYLRRWVAPRTSLDSPGINPADLPQNTPHLTTGRHDVRLK
jgi:hypothetical protein